MTIRLLVMFLFGLLVISIPCYVAAQAKGIASPRLVGKGDDITVFGKGNNGNDETPGEWFVGETPEHPQEGAPVLLFVPGLNNVAQIFWEDNGLYEAAYEAGYHTAFVQLYDAGGASADMWDNGRLLADKIEEIAAHFNGQPITLVAYSKGGVDAQAAVTYYDAWQYVDNIITLSSPHHGSQLADLANSSWAGWLADLLGMQGEGTTAVETGYMEHFRSITDSEPYAYYNDIYTLGGTDWGSIFSATWYGGVYLSSYGDNDGVVTAVSSNLPGGQEIAIGDWNHTSVRSEVIFPVFESFIADESVPGRSFSPSSYRMPLPTSDHLVRGNSLVQNKSDQLSLPIEDGVDEITVQVYAAHELNQLALIDPSGKSYIATQATTQESGGIFTGATAYTIPVKNPVSGEWMVELGSKQDSAYLLVANYDTPRKWNLVSNMNKNSKNKSFYYQLKTDDSFIQEDSLKASYKIVESGTMNEVKSFSTKGNVDMSTNLTFPKKNQAYNITVDISGKTKKGSTFERTIIDSVYIED
ncbi:hypothetical protein GT022_12395 [Agaribacter marinus]|uniref:GPI inositol-deacylase PGAP1-like alpha/beta domain-containing protein n=2 Tax=Virgibacillus salarius TaxID=447199 RepID=A0A941ID67_9BACI|nr:MULTISPECIES: hypothetical protein [Bacillaceae]MBR7796845.1 hypothetical protein [Virgibacillus salarius]NAZ09555.1 hypothetical protein [Agaribacter marinus]